MALIALLGTIVTAIAGMGKFTRREAVQLESRLSAIEHSIETLCSKVDPMWDAILNEIPRLLIKEDTPELDDLMRQVSNGIDSMTDDQIRELVSYLDVECEKAVDLGDTGRAIGIVFLRARVRGRID